MPGGGDVEVGPKLPVTVGLRSPIVSLNRSSARPEAGRKCERCEQDILAMQPKLTQEHRQ